jgi:transcriptional regulator with XRE-family HTH domain
MDGIARRVAEALAAKGWKQTDLVAASGISSGGVSNWALGKVKPEHVKADTLIKITSALGVRPEWLLYERGPMLDTVTVRESHPLRPDPAILIRALKFMDRQAAMHGVTFDPLRDAELLAYAYEIEAKEQAQAASPGNLLDFGEALRKRIGSMGATNDKGGTGATGT